MELKRTFEEDLEAAATYHGHLCAGQLLGVRMARLGCRLLGIAEPQKYRDLIVFIENNRCLSDAIGTVTGCTLGKRRLKFKDYGKSAASFLDIASKNAFRISSKGWQKVPDGEDLASYFAKIPDEELFNIEEVKIELAPEDMPGPPVEKVRCSVCGEFITDKRHILRGGEAFCKSCAGISYYMKRP